MDQKQRKTVSDIQKVRIGQNVYSVTSRVVSVPYHDHGHTYYGISKHYFVYETVFGKQIEFDLGKLMGKHGVKVRVLQWDE